MAKNQLSQISLGPQGPGVQGPSAAIQAVQQITQNQQQQSQKMMQTLLKMQQESDARANAQAQQTAGAVADVANQVAGGLQQRMAQKNAREAKVEDLQVQEDMMAFEQQMAQESSREAERIGNMMQSARTATASAIETWGQRKADVQLYVDRLRDTYNNLIKDGKFNQIPNGARAVDDIYRELRSAEAFKHDAFDPAYLRSAAKRLSDVERDILEGRDPVDLAALYDRPETSVFQAVSADEKLPELTGEQRRDMSIRDGYPKEGLLGLAVDDPRRNHVRFSTPGFMREALMFDADYASQLTDEARRKMLEAKMRMTHDSLEMMNKYAKSYAPISDMMFSRSAPAITAGLLNFSKDATTGKWSDVGENLTLSIMSEMFPENPGIVDLVRNIRNRAVELDTPAELASAMAVEAAAASIENRAALLISAANEGSLAKNEKQQLTSMLSGMAEQWASSKPRNVVSQVVGSDGFMPDGSLSGPGLMRAQLYLQQQLETVKSYAGELKSAAHRQGALSQFSEQFGANLRMGDFLSVMYSKQADDDKKKAFDLLYKKAEEGTAQEVAGMSSTDLGLTGGMTFERLGEVKFADTPEIARSKGVMSHLIEFLDEVSPHEVPLVASLLSGGTVKMEDPSTQVFDEALKDETKFGEYLQLSKQSLKDRREMVEAAKAASNDGVPWTPQQGLSEKKKREALRADLQKQLRAREQYGSWSFQAGLAAREAGKQVLLPGHLLGRGLSKAGGAAAEFFKGATTDFAAGATGKDLKRGN